MVLAIVLVVNIVRYLSSFQNSQFSFELIQLISKPLEFKLRKNVRFVGTSNALVQLSFSGCLSSHLHIFLLSLPLYSLLLVVIVDLMEFSRVGC